MHKIIEGAQEAVAFARGEKPAARLTVNGHAYVPEASLPPSIVELTSLLRLIAKHTAPGHRTFDALLKDMDQACDYARSALKLVTHPKQVNQ